MSPKIDQKDINNAAWAACDTFRGVVDPAQYKDYILVMLFVKYISDVWKDHYEEYRKQYGDDDVRIRRQQGDFALHVGERRARAQLRRRLWFTQQAIAIAITRRAMVVLNQEADQLSGHLQLFHPACLFRT